MGLYKGNVELSAMLGGVEANGIYLGSKEIWTSFTPFEHEFAYKGSVEEFVVLSKGLYKLEVWGAQGGNGQSTDAKGGYSIGYVVLNKNDTLYIVCGGLGQQQPRGTRSAGGYNGGGYGWDSGYGAGSSGGGGATHIAKVSGVLSSIGYESFVAKNNGYIVAGGGGGRYIPTDHAPFVGGTGGGLTGGGGTNYDGVRNTGATQITGYAFGQGVSYVQGYSSYAAAGGGGGGLYGGKSINTYDSGGGGSGYIGGVPTITYKDITYSPSTTNGVNSGNGKAKITRIA